MSGGLVSGAGPFLGLLQFERGYCPGHRSVKCWLESRLANVRANGLTPSPDARCYKSVIFGQHLTANPHAYHLSPKNGELVNHKHLVVFNRTSFVQNATEVATSLRYYASGPGPKIMATAWATPLTIVLVLGLAAVVTCLSTPPEVLVEASSQGMRDFMGLHYRALHRCVSRLENSFYFTAFSAHTSCAPALVRAYQLMLVSSEAFLTAPCVYITG